MRLCAILFFIFYLQSICSQPLQSGKVTTKYTSKHFTIADGLPQIQITYLYCDSKGFVWVGTKFGVARWDGKKFKVFTPKEGAAGKQVIQIAELPGGEIVVSWLGSAFNIIRGDVIETIQTPKRWNATALYGFTSYEADKLIFYVNSFSDDKYLKKSVVAVYDLKKHRITKEIWLPQWWVSKVTSEGYIITADYDIYQNKPGTFHLYHLNQLIETRNFNIAFTNFNYSQSPRLRFYANSDHSVLLDVIVENKKLQLIRKFNGLDEPVTDHHARYLNQVDSFQTIYSNENQELILKNRSEKANLGKLSQMVYSIKDKENNLWVGTENGLYCFYRFGFQELQFNVQPGTLDAIWSMTKAKDGSYYYASYDKGFWVSRDQNKTWGKLEQLSKPALPERMTKGSYGAIGLHNGAVILPTSMGFYYLKEKKLIPYYLLGKGSEVYAAWEDTINQRVLISKHTFLFSLNLKTLQLDTIFKCPQFGLQTILAITQDLQNNPIITGRGAACILKNGKWQALKGTENARVMSSVTDSWGSLWLGMPQQLTCIKNDSAYTMKHFPGRQLVLSLTTWKKKWLVIGGGFELIFLDLETFYKTGQELYQRYDAGSGFITTEGGQNSFVHETDGSIWWPCSDKVIRFWPDKLLAQTTLFNKPVILMVSAAGKKDSSVLLTDTAYAGSFHVNQSFRNLRYEFGTAAMNNYDNLVYRHRLKGLDTNWSKSAANGNAVYGNLKPGTYIFEVQSSTDAVSWSAVTSALPVTLPAWWYETLLFKMMAVLFSIAGVAFITWWLMQRNRKETERSKLINELQLKAIRSKALPHFSGNAFANIDFYIEKGDTENASRYLAILSRLHNITLMDSDKSARTLEEELNYVKLYLEMEKLRFEEHLNYSIAVDENVNTQILIPNMVLHTFTENAIKHGIKNKTGQGTLKIEAVVKEQGVMLSVSDNGIGRAAAKKANGVSTRQGLEILSRQIELYNQQNKNKIRQTVLDLTDENGAVTGTCFSVFIPDEYRYEL